jgi:hypothetical protein
VYTDPASADDAGSTGYQEFLAYTTGSVITNSFGTPEPATFWLLGIALILGGVLSRRKTLKTAE